LTRAIRGHLRSNIVGYVSLFVALTMGSAYALNDSNTVFSDDIVNGEVKGVDRLNNAIRSEDIRDDNVTDGGLTASDLAANAVSASEVRNDAVGNSELRNNAVGSSEVDDGDLTGHDVIAPSSACTSPRPRGYCSSAKRRRTARAARTACRVTANSSATRASSFPTRDFQFNRRTSPRASVCPR
jgi:hypothetical protein